MDLVICGSLLFVWFTIGSIGNALERRAEIEYSERLAERQSEEVDDTMFYTSMWLSMEGD